MVNEKPDETILSRHKIFAHKDRLEEWLRTGKSGPITAELDPTNACNYNCKGCAGGRHPLKASQTEKESKKIIDRITGPIRGIVLTGGGEPLANKNIIEIIRHSKNNGMDVGVITNGYYLTDEKLENITQTILENCQWIRISLDATDNRTYSQRKGTAEENFEVVLENIRRLTRLKRLHGSNTTIGTAYLTNNETKEELREFIILAKDLGTDYAQFRPYHSSRLKPQEKILTAIKVNKDLETDTFKIIYPEYKYKEMNYHYKRSFGDEFRIVISATGDLYPDCYTRGKRNFIYGNLLEETLEEIWNSKRKQEVFAKKLEQPNCPEESKKDQLNEILWNIHINKQQSNQETYLNELYERTKNLEHINFI